LLKLDFEKAYDKVDWQFLVDVLRAEGLVRDGLARFILAYAQ